MKTYLQIHNIISKARLQEGDFVVTSDDEDVIAGRVEHVMTEGMFGLPGSEYAIEASQEEPAILLRKFEQEEESGLWEETQWLIGKPENMCTPIQMLPLEEESMSKGLWTGAFDPKGLI